MSTIRKPSAAVASVALLLITMIGSLAPAPAQAVTLGRISGTVTGPDAVPVGNVEVYATQLDGDDYGYVSTTGSGTYTIFGLTPGQYIIEFLPGEGSGLVSEVYDDASFNDPTEVTVASGLTTSGIDAQLSEGGSIAGTVSLPESVSPFEVIVVAQSAAGGDFSGLSFDGTYQIDGLRSGDYVVSFDFMGPTDAVPERYDDVRMPLDATMVTVVDSGEVTGIDATIGLCTSPADFDDVSATNPFCGSIDWLIDASITTGYPDGTFRPGALVTRAAMAAFLYRLSGSPAVSPLAPGTCVFSDVCAGHPFEAAIVWIDAEGIAGGYADGTYRPGAKVSRQAMASFLYKMAGEPPSFLFPFPPEFCDLFYTDVCGNQFLDEIMWLTFSGIAGGYEDGGFHPTAAVTRQAMASFLTRFEGYQQLTELFGPPFGPFGTGFGSKRAEMRALMQALAS